VNDINETLNEYARNKQEISRLTRENESLREIIVAYCLATGEKLETDLARTSFRGEYKKATWNGNGLKGYAVAHPEILVFLNEKTVPPTAVITLR